MSRRQQNKSRSKARIVEAAAALIAEHGAANTTTREIARRAGVSYQTLYNYFPTKGSVIQAVMREDLAAWGSAADLAIKHYGGDLLTTLNRMNRIAVIRFDGEHRELWRELSLQMQLTALNQASHERYHALLSMAQGMGELRQGVDLHLLAHTLFCLTDYAMMRYLSMRREKVEASPDQAAAGQGFLGHDAEAFLQTLLEQLTLVVQPYLA